MKAYKTPQDHSSLVIAFSPQDLDSLLRPELDHICPLKHLVSENGSWQGGKEDAIRINYRPQLRKGVISARGSVTISNQAYSNLNDRGYHIEDNCDGAIILKVQ